MAEATRTPSKAISDLAHCSKSKTPTASGSVSAAQEPSNHNDPAPYYLNPEDVPAEVEDQWDLKLKVDEIVQEYENILSEKLANTNFTSTLAQLRKYVDRFRTNMPKLYYSDRTYTAWGGAIIELIDIDPIEDDGDANTGSNPGSSNGSSKKMKEFHQRVRKFHSEFMDEIRSMSQKRAKVADWLLKPQYNTAEKRNKKYKQIISDIETLHKQIKLSDATELTLDDLINEKNACTFGDKCRKRIVQLEEQLNELLGFQSYTGRNIYKKFSFSSGQFPDLPPALLTALESVVNRMIGRREAPHVLDIKQAIEKITASKNLKLPRPIDEIAFQISAIIIQTKKTREKNDLDTYLTDLLEEDYLLPDDVREEFKLKGGRIDMPKHPELEKKLEQSAARFKKVVEKKSLAQFVSLDKEPVNGQKNADAQPEEADEVLSRTSMSSEDDREETEKDENDLTKLIDQAIERSSLNGGSASDDEEIEPEAPDNDKSEDESASGGEDENLSNLSQDDIEDGNMDLDENESTSPATGTDQADTVAKPEPGTSGSVLTASSSLAASPQITAPVDDKPDTAPEQDRGTKRKREDEDEELLIDISDDDDPDKVAASAEAVYKKVTEIQVVDLSDDD